MPTRLLDGHTTWEGEIDADGHRTYHVTFRVESGYLDGPANVMQTPGLPVPGTYWLVDNDVDVWAWFRRDGKVKPEVEGEKNRFWTVEMTASTKPPGRESGRGAGGGGTCADRRVEDPLLEPQKVSGTFVKYTEEATFDKDGDPIRNSAWEMVRGPKVEFDKNRPQVTIEQNVFPLGLATFSQMIDTVNDAPLWGLPARCWKLANVSWEKKFYGACSVYYTRKFDFDGDYRTHDRVLADEGTRVMIGDWDRDPNSLTFKTWKIATWLQGNPVAHLHPFHFKQYTDWDGQPGRVLLNGAGRPWDPEMLSTGTGDDTVGRITVQKYSESNFLLLGIPVLL